MPNPNTPEKPNKKRKSSTSWDLILHASLGELAGVAGDAMRDDERRVLSSETHSDVPTRRTYKGRAGVLFRGWRNSIQKSDRWEEYQVDDDEIGASLRDELRRNCRLQIILAVRNIGNFERSSDEGRRLEELLVRASLAFCQSERELTG
ncbi:hypothetical protein ACJRO7_034175 [Eucalyptus globulus]|uniref:Uncharacterized protein n=1 Tax=Eucalyptus globulus TaxID=34317 RepID=A0ABD3J7Z9_EUCGL